MSIAWGPQFIQFYNDACLAILGDKHPQALGRSTRETFDELWTFIEPIFRDVTERRMSRSFTDQPLSFRRNGRTDEAFFTFSCGALTEDNGDIGGVFITLLETTSRILGERRLRALRDVLDIKDATSVPTICGAVADIFRRNANDIPFALLYYDAGNGALELCGKSGLPDGDRLAPKVIDPRNNDMPQPALTAMMSGEIQFTKAEIARKEFPFKDAVTLVASIPITPAGYYSPVAVMVAGVSPRLSFDAEYEDFLRSVAFNIASVVAAAEAYDHQRKRADAATALAESEARLSFALRAGRLGYWEIDPTTRAIFVSDIYKANWGRQPAESFTYETLKTAVHPDDLVMHETAVQKAIDQGGALDIDYRVIWPDRSVHWLRVRGHAVYNREGKPLRMAGISLDITDRKQIEESLREETAALEQLNALGTALAANLDVDRIVQSVTDAATEIAGARFGAFFYKTKSDDSDNYMLYALSGVSREAFDKFLLPRDAPILNPDVHGIGSVRSDDIRKDLRYGKVVAPAVTEDHLRVVSYLSVPVISRNGRVLGGLFFGHERPNVFTERVERVVNGIAAQAAIAIDNANLFAAAQSEIAERRRVEKHQELLLAELNHRVRNTLAIVQSIAGQTLRHADSAASFRSGFEARIMALSEAHKLLTDSNWEGARLSDIIDRVLSPYALGSPRYTLAMDADVRVGPNTAVSLVMAFHELATNAAKYGALSNAVGQVQIACKVMVGKTSPRLNVHWQEIDGPRIRPPSRKGFGSRLIQSLSADTGGQVRLDFSESGLICEFDIPLVLAKQS